MDSLKIFMNFATLWTTAWVIANISKLRQYHKHSICSASACGDHPNSQDSILVT